MSSPRPQMEASGLPRIRVTFSTHWDIISNLEFWCPHKWQEQVLDPTVHSKTGQGKEPCSLQSYGNKDTRCSPVVMV